MTATQGPEATPRRYRSPRRARQAEQTRADVLAAAVELFAEQGWAATTVTAIAERAGVAVETVYRGFGTKKELLRQASQVAIVGDAQPIPLVDRDEMRPVLSGPPDQRARACAEWLAVAYRDRRLAAVWTAMLEAAASDPEVAEWCKEEEQHRSAMIDIFLTGLGHKPSPVAADIIWLIASPEAYTKLTTQRGWTTEQWTNWISDMLTRQLTESDNILQL